MRNKTSNFQELKELISYSKNYKWHYIGGTVFSFLNKFFDVAPEILIGIAIDVVVSKKESFVAQFGFVNPFEQLQVLAALTMLIWICESLFEYLLLLTWCDLAQRIQHQLRQQTFNHLQTLHMGFFENQNSGNLVSVLNDDINQLERFLNGGANSLIQVFSTVLLVGGVFVWISPLLALMSFLPTPVILWGAFYFQKKAAPLYAAVRDKAGVLGAMISNQIIGIAQIQSCTMEEQESSRLLEASQDYLRANSEAIRVSSAFIPLIRMAILAGFICTFVFGGQMALRSELNIGLYGVLVFLTQRLLWPMTGFAETVDLYQRAMASVSRIFSILHEKSEIFDSPHAIAKVPYLDAIQFKNINFAYPQRPKVLQNFNLEVPFGKTIALVGPTGSGKSTIAKLLLRFYEPESGQILFGEQELKQFEIKGLRKSIGYVSQDVFLFPGTVAENISSGLNRKISREAIIEAARLAHAHDFILNLPNGYDTEVGERGQKLSGGQRQRIAIARVILRDPPILIFDEATSAIDNETEALIQKSIVSIRKNRTMIMIAHRLSTVVDADQIIVLDHGQIQQMGTHAELIAKPGLYAQLWAGGIQPPNADSNVSAAEIDK